MISDIPSDILGRPWTSAFTPAQEALRAEVRDWLDANVPRLRSPSMDTADGFEAHRAWERTLFDGGWGVVSWPADTGAGAPGVLEWLIFEEEYCARRCTRTRQPERSLSSRPDAHVPRHAGAEGAVPSGDGARRRDLVPGLVGAERRQRHGRHPYEGDARRRRLVIEGQKTWCSRGVWADWMFGLFRSEPGSERHRGLTMILAADGHAGVDARPIAQLDGETGFAEVFFDGARVPVENTLGEPGQGWNVAMTTAGLRARPVAPSARTIPRDREATCRSLPGRRRAGDVPRRRRARADRRTAVPALRLWTAARLARGETIGPESSVNKLFWSTMDMRMHADRDATCSVSRGSPADGRPRWIDGYYFSLAGPIYAGTNEIQRNIIGERVLGLPRELATSAPEPRRRRGIATTDAPGSLSKCGRTCLPNSSIALDRRVERHVDRQAEHDLIGPDVLVLADLLQHLVRRPAQQVSGLDALLDLFERRVGKHLRPFGDARRLRERRVVTEHERHLEPAAHVGRDLARARPVLEADDACS